MSTRSGIVLVIVTAACLLALSIGIRRLQAAEAHYKTVSGQLAITMSDAQEIMRLRSQSQRADDRKRPEQDLIARVHAVMADAGIPIQEHFKSLRGEADQSLPGNQRYRQQSVSLSLQNIQPQQLGAFLIAWVSTQPVWNIARIELLHERERQASDANSFSAVVSFTAIYVADNRANQT